MWNNEQSTVNKQTTTKQTEYQDATISPCKLELFIWECPKVIHILNEGHFLPRNGEHGCCHWVYAEYNNVWF